MNNNLLSTMRNPQPNCSMTQISELLSNLSELVRRRNDWFPSENSAVSKGLLSCVKINCSILLLGFPSGREWTMKIAILGSGKVGGNLGKRWAAAGHTIVYGSRDPNSDKVKELLNNIGAQASATGEAEAVRDAEVVLLAVPYHAAQGVLANVGDLGGRVLIDATNALAQGGPAVPLSPASSAGLNVASWAKNARVVKAFNTIGSAVMMTPEVDGRPVTLLYAGDDVAAKAVVRRLIQDIGFDPVDAGPLSNAYLLEAMCLLWIDLAYARGMGQVGFSLLRPS
jgi:hypothetical protein